MQYMFDLWSFLGGGLIGAVVGAGATLFVEVRARTERRELRRREAVVSLLEATEALANETHGSGARWMNGPPTSWYQANARALLAAGTLNSLLKKREKPVHSWVICQIALLANARTTLTNSGLRSGLIFRLNEWLAGRIDAQWFKANIDYWPEWIARINP